MFNFHYKKAFIFLLLISCLLNKSSNVDAVKCYECASGRNTFCDSDKLILKDCGSSYDSCGFALFNGGIYTGMQRADWRGCYKISDMNYTVTDGSTITDDLRFRAISQKKGGYLTDFLAYLKISGYSAVAFTVPAPASGATTSAQLALSSFTIAGPPDVYYQNAWAFVSYCSSDGCNVPKLCYRCTSDIDTTCTLSDIILDTCTSILHTYCASITVGTNYWRGCLRDLDNTALTNAASSSTTATAYSDALKTAVRYAKSRVTQTCSGTGDLCGATDTGLGQTACLGTNTCLTANLKDFILEPDSTAGTNTFPSTSTYSNFRSCNTNGCNFGTSIFEKINLKYAILFLFLTLSSKF